MRSISEITPALSFRVIAPSCRFSSTVMVVKVPRPCGTWAMPRRTMFSVERPVSGAPSNSIAPVEHHVADRAQGGGLAGAVGPEQRGQASFIEGELETVKRLDLTVIGSEILDVEHRGHWSLLPR